MKGLIISVGTSPAPVVYSLETFKPDWVAFFVTSGPQGSDRVLDIVLDQCQHKVAPSRMKKEETEDSPAACGKMLRKGFGACEWLEQQVGHANIELDPTGGRKWMSAALIMLACERGIPIRYVDINTKWREPGLVDRSQFADMSAVSVTDAYKETGIHRARTAARLFDRGLYDAAYETLISISVPDCLYNDLFLGLGRVARGCGLIDAFHHYSETGTKQALSLLSEGREALERFICSGPFRQKALIQFHQGAQTLHDSIRQFHDHWNEPTLAFVADLVQNAQRRLDRGSYDDATARLYRAAEAYAQYRLITRFNIITEDVAQSLNRAEPIVKKTVEAFFVGKVPQKIGLDTAYRILALLKDPAGTQMVIGTLRQADRPQPTLIEKCVRARNKSIFAHGFKPVSKSDCALFATTLQDYIAGVEGPGWHRLFEGFRIPNLGDAFWLSDTQ